MIVRLRYIENITKTENGTSWLQGGHPSLKLRRGMHIMGDFLLLVMRFSGATDGSLQIIFSAQRQAR